MPAPGRVAVVTGASRGIGGVHRSRVGRRPYAVCLLARDESAAVGVAGEIASAGGQASARSLNVTDQVAAREAVLSAWGRIDLLVNSAGSIEREVPLWEADVDQWWWVIRTNVRGPFAMIRAVVPHMIAAGADGLST